MVKDVIGKQNHNVRFETKDKVIATDESSTQTDFSKDSYVDDEVELKICTLFCIRFLYFFVLSKGKSDFVFTVKTAQKTSILLWEVFYHLQHVVQIHQYS